MRALVLTLLAGCSFSTRLGGDGEARGDGGLDSAIDAPALDAFDDRCFGGGTFYLCLAALPTGAANLDDSNTLDTTACNASGLAKAMIGTTEVCVLAADTITLSPAQFTGVGGDLPLVLTAVTSIAIDGKLDVSSVTGDPGPGANAAQCDATGTDGTTGANGGGGGAGGSFGTAGNNGGTGNAGSGGVATPAVAKSPVLRGGCPGGTGMPGGTLAAAGGPGGGALYLVSRGSITVTGTIDASGGGGTGGVLAKGGGGGGGSGGMIVFHASSLVVSSAARIVANGGGGGGGAGNTVDGDDGFEPDPTTPNQQAAGGLTTTMGRSSGGAGAAGVTGASPGGNGGNGGGGGGGGLGQIRVLKGGTSFPAGTTSPAPTT